MDGSCDCCGHARNEHDLEGCGADFAGMSCICAVSWGVDVIPDEWHVIPTGDIVAHDESSQCGCQPHVDATRDGHGLPAYLVTHAAWDGRP